MKQLFKEISMLLIIMPICFVILFFAMQKIEQSRQVEKLTGAVEKKELTISSPVFGSIEEFSVQEGTLVKKDQTIAVISVIDKKDFSSLNSDVYEYNEKNETIQIKSPTEAVVSEKELAEKSTIKPEENILTLHPLANTVVKIQVDSERSLKFFESISLTDTDESFNYPLVLSERLPVTDKLGNTYYYATLADADVARDLYNNQKVVIKVRREGKALTGRIESSFNKIANNITTTIDRYL